MPERRIFPAFREEYMATPYPFMDTATLTGSTGQKLDRDLFLDASIYPINAVDAVYISSVEIQPQQVRIALSDKSRKELATAVFDPLNTEPVIGFRDSYDRPAGILVSDVDRLARFTAWNIGRHEFAAAATTFVPSCVIPTAAKGVEGFTVDGTTLHTGDVVLVGRNGVVLRSTAEGVIRVDIVGDPLFRRRLCSPIDLFANPNFIRTINGCPPDAYGNFNLTVGDNANPETIIRISPNGTGLTIEAVGATTQTGGA